MEKSEAKATEYAKSITKNDTYQGYLKDAFIAGVKSKGNVREWQRCPVCDAQGQVKASFAGTTAGYIYNTCTVCKGAKIIERPY